jgi:hypothetical protein
MGAERCLLLLFFLQSNVQQTYFDRRYQGAMEGVRAKQVDLFHVACCPGPVLDLRALSSAWLPGFSGLCALCLTPGAH